MPWALLAVAMVLVFAFGMLAVVFTQAARSSRWPFTMLDRVRLFLGIAPLFGMIGFLILTGMRTQGLLTFDPWVDGVWRYGLFACITCVFALHVVKFRQTCRGTT